MTDLLIRSATARRPAPRRSRRLALAAGAAALVAAGTGLVAVAAVVLLVWSTDGRSGSSAADALRTAGQVWLVAHHTGLALPQGHFGLLPLGLIVLPALLLVRAGAGLGRAVEVARPRDAVLPLLTLAGCYAAMAWLVARLAASAGVHPSMRQAVPGAFVLALLSGGAGLTRSRGLLPAMVAPMPARALVLARASGAALATLLAAGALLAGGMLAWHAGRAGELAAGLEPGLVGGFALLAVCLVYLPVGVVWGAAYVVGPGFAVGVGTAVSPFGTSLGAVPALPLLAALPDTDGTSPAALLVLLLPVGAGTLAGWLSLRHPVDSRRDAALWGLACGPCVGVALALLAWLASGPVGAHRLATLGPSPWQVGLTAAAEVGLGAAATAWLRHGRWVQQRSAGLSR